MYSVEWKDDQCVMTDNGCGTEQSWRNLKHCYGFCL